MPNFRLYYEAVCLAWVKDWWTLENRRLLNLEGFNARFGWHAYLFYSKHKVDNIFSHHYIRQSLLNVWLKYRRYLPDQIPPWVVPCEVLKTAINEPGEGWLTYGDLLEVREGNEIYLKPQDKISYNYNWLQYYQIHELYKKDHKEFGHRLNLSDLEEIILDENNKKLISRIYKKLLEWYAEDEQVKEYMTKWSININRMIDMDTWEYFWKKSSKIATCFQIK